jgi:dTMP kinase
MPRGLFITFEGSEGCGKSTQIKRLSDRLGGLNMPFITTREPGGTPIGEEIRHLLQFSKAGYSMVSEAELLLFAASRAQLVREVILPALDAGTTVVADRFLDSTTVYQGVARKIETASVKFINEFAVGSCLPDITFLLDLDLATATERMRHRAQPAGEVDRMEQQPAEFYEAVRAGYLKLAAGNPGRIRLIDASKSIDEIEAQIWNHLEEKLKAKV